MTITNNGAPNDFERAFEVASAVNSDRSLMAASRLVDNVIEPYMDNTYFRHITPDETALDGLLLIYSVYPEAFKHVGTRGEQPLNKEDIVKGFPFILENGGLPVIEESWQIFRKLTYDELEQKADLREQIAEALYDTPPNTDFLFDCNLMRLQTDKYPINVVLDLFNSVNNSTKEVTELEEKTSNDLEYLMKETTATTKMQNTITLLLETRAEAINSGNLGFGQEVTEALNNDDTSLADLRELWLAGRSRIVDQAKQHTEETRYVFEAILSGEASTYEPQP